MDVDNGNTQRDLMGCVVSVENIATGQRLTWYVAGKRGAALRNIAHRLDRLGVFWKVSSYCTPATINADLDGTRYDAERRHPGAHEHPETMAFSRIGRIDLVHPRLIGGVKRESRHRGRW